MPTSDLHPGDTQVGNLAAERNAFVGRAEELAEAKTLWARDERLVTILGGPGVGKSRFAVNLARELVSTGRFTGGVWICDLSEATTAADLVARLGRAIGIAASSVEDESILDMVAADLKRRGPTLIVLDNFERLVSCAPSTVGHWLGAAAELCFLVTSRERLAVEGEVCRELMSLPIPDAIELFERRAGAVRRQLASNDAALVRSIVERLDGVPLAIELAASRTAALSLGELSSRLEKRFDLLVASRQDAPARHSSLEEAITWSWEMLPEWGSAAMSQSAVFCSGFAVEAAEAVLDLSAHSDAPPIIDVLQTLASRSLLLLQEDERGIRFSTIKSIRSYALDRIDHEVLQATQMRHTDYFVNQAEAWAAACAGPAGDVGRKLLMVNIDDLLALVQRCRIAAPGTAARVVIALHPLVLAQGLYASHRSLFDTGVECAVDAQDNRLEARARRARGTMRQNLGMTGTIARQDFERVRQLAQTLNDPLLEAQALMGSAHLLFHDTSGPNGPSEALRAAYAIFVEIGDHFGAANAACNLAVVSLDGGDLNSARTLTDEAMGHAKDLPIVVFPLLIAGAIAQDAGDFDTARGQYEESLRLSKDSMRHHEAETLSHLCMLESELGHWRDASDYAQQAIALYELLAMPNLGGFALAFLAVSQVVLGEREAAELHLAESRPLLKTLEAMGGEIVLFAANAYLHQESSALAPVASSDSKRPFTARVMLRVVRQASTPSDAETLCIGTETRWFQLGDGERVELGRRKVLRRLLASLVEHHLAAHGEPAAITDMIAAGWPDESMQYDAATNRLYVAISKLRKLGLGDILVKHADGYLLDPQVFVLRE